MASRSASRRRSGSARRVRGKRVAAHFEAVGLPTRIADIPGAKPDVEALMRLMSQDKKVRRGKLTFILVRGIGEAFVTRDVAEERVREFLTGEIAGARR